MSTPVGERVVTQRYGQLTYTSFDGRGVGGWQVKDQLGLDEAEVELLRSRIDPQIDTGTELPRFPSPDDVERFPRRLVFAPRPFSTEGDGLSPATGGERDRTVAWWHHASAGLDGSGRPGNVFTHVLVDRAPDGVVSHRPIDLWRSPDWLTPWGPDAVLATTLGSQPPGPGELIDPPGLAAFLLDLGHYRLGVLSVLLDACAATVDGGPPVVLATDSTDTAAWWVAAVTHLMSPGAAFGFGFSTLERLASLPSRFAAGLPLCCVPRSDYDSLREAERTFVLLADDEAVAIGDLDGEPHLTAAGDRVTVTEWSVLAKVVLIDSATASWALSQLDAVANAIDEDVGLRSEPAWPLAMVVASAPEHFSDAIPEASRVLIRRSPTALRTAPELLESARSLIADSLGGATGDAWDPLDRVLVPGEPLTVVGEMMLSIYVSRAVADVAWLTRPGGPPLPTAQWSSEDRPAELAEALTAAVGTLLAGDRTEQTARALAALTNFAIQLDLLSVELADDVSVGLAQDFVPLLFEPEADELVASLGRFAEQTLDAVIRPLVNRALVVAQPPLGDRLSTGVLRWLYGHGTPHLIPRSTQPYEEFRLRGELAVQFVRRDPARYAGERPLAAIALLEEGADVEALFEAPLWSIRELTAIEERFPGRLPLRLFAPAFKASGSGVALDDLGMLLLRSRRSAGTYEPGGPGDLLRMRLAATERWWMSPRYPAQLALVLSGAVHALEYEDVDFHADALDQLYAALVLAIAGGLPRTPAQGAPAGDDVRTLVAAVGKPAEVAGAFVWNVVSDGARAQLAVDQLVAAALLGEPDFPEPAMSTPLHRWAHQVKVDVDGVRGPVLRQCVAHQVADGGETLDGLVDAVRRRWLPKFRRAHNPERTARLVQKYIQSWLKSLFPAEGLLGRKR